MSHSKKTRAFRRVLPCLLAGTLLLSSVPVLAVDDGVEPTYDEAYYAMTDYYGNLTEGSVVKSYTVNGASSLTDYGDYDEIVNLTDDRVPTSAAGGNVFSFDGDAPEHFYFEGKTAQPFEDLPWTLSVHYTLNGVAAKAEDLAGKTGVVEIQIDAIPNENASEYAKRNYTLEAMALFNQDDILSLEAPGAQVQLIGNLRAVLFLGLPGEECHYTIRVGSNAFSFGGMTFLMVPATLSQLQEIATLSQRKDDLEENYEKLSQGIDALLDSLGGISSGLYSAANGLDQLNAARETLSQNGGTLSWQADAVLGDLNALNSSLATLPGHLDRGKKLLSDTEKDVKALNAALTEARDELEDIQVDVKALKTDLARISAASSASASDLEALGKKADTLGKHLDKLSAILQAIELRLRGEGVQQGAAEVPDLAAGEAAGGGEPGLQFPGPVHGLQQGQGPLPGKLRPGQEFRRGEGAGQGPQGPGSGSFRHSVSSLTGDRPRVVFPSLPMIAHLPRGGKPPAGKMGKNPAEGAGKVPRALATASGRWYTGHGKQKCGSLQVRQHPQACAGGIAPTQRP